MKLSRRAILQASLGLTQAGLLSKLGLLGTPARAAGGDLGPTKIVTIFMAGGWMPQYLWCPLTDDEIRQYIPRIDDSQTEPVFFGPDQVKNLDGTVDAREGAYPRLRVPNLWTRPGRTSPHGRAWEHFGLWANCSVVHGVDQGTASHDAGQVSALTGVATSDFRSPAINAWVASGLFTRFESTRPLPSVVIGGMVPEAVHLRAEVSPISIASMTDLRYGLSEGVGRAWDGLKDRQVRQQLDFRERPIGNFPSNALEDRRSRRLRALRGRSTPDTDAFLEKLYNGYQGVSKLLARDIVSEIGRIEDYPPFRTLDWVTGPNDFSFPYGNGTDPYDMFNLSLKLLKSNLVTSLSLMVPTSNLDTHAEGHAAQFMRARSAFDAVGRFLGIMKNTPATGRPGMLLDDTLVLIVSDFSRTWPGSNTCDHWPSTSVAFVGGGVAPNRMVGGYQIDSGSPVTTTGFEGKEMLMADGSRRQPRSADVIHTALRIMNIDDFFIPGGSSEIIGLRA